MFLFVPIFVLFFFTTGLYKNIVPVISIFLFLKLSKKDSFESLLCCESNTLVLSRFFSYAVDAGLFLKTGKGLTCAVFTGSVDLRPN